MAEFYLHDESKYEEIADYNGIEDSSLIFPNQVVRIPTGPKVEDPNCLYVGQILLIPCKKKLEQVQQRNYTEQYNRMGERLHQQQECYKPCEVHQHCHSMSPHH